MNASNIFAKVLDRAALTAEEAYWLWEHAPLEKLAAVADEVRRLEGADERSVAWQVDRKVKYYKCLYLGM